MADKNFKTEITFLNFLENLKFTDVKSENFIAEAEIVKILDKVALLSPEIVMDTFDIPHTEENEEAVERAIRESGCMLKVPVGGVMSYVPIADIAFESLCGRAKLWGKSTDINPLILNEGFILAPLTEEGKAKTLIRGGCLLASHSKLYEWLDQFDLVSANRMVFTELFKTYEVRDMTYNDEVTSALYLFSDRKEEILAKYIDKGGSASEVVPCIRFSTSDTTRSGANLIPYFLVDGNPIRIGGGLCLPHKNGNSLSDYIANLNNCYVMLQESGERFAKLLDIKIEHPIECFRNLVKEFKLPVDYAAMAFEDFEATVGTTTTAYKLYTSLWMIAHYAKSSSDLSKQFALEEKLYKVFRCNFAEFDHIF